MDFLGTVRAVVFALGGFGSLQRAPYGLLFAKVIWPRLGTPAETEDARPPRFAQLVGLGFVVIALAGFLSGATLIGYVAAAFALIAALLNASVGLCLGCETYLVLRRFTPNELGLAPIGWMTIGVALTKRLKSSYAKALKPPTRLTC